MQSGVLFTNVLMYIQHYYLSVKVGSHCTGELLCRSQLKIMYIYLVLLQL